MGATIQATIQATIRDLYAVEKKAEIIRGKVVCLMPTGRMPARVAFMITMQLELFIRANQLPGVAVPDNAGFIVDLPNRTSFSPDASYYVGPDSGMKFFEGAPIFAVEIRAVRSEGDYGPQAEREMPRQQLEKRADYFAAGTQVVWDVDLLNTDIVIRKFAASDAQNPQETFTRAQIANAEPAVPGWTLSVQSLFDN
jgi:Uma2 family endonuclease